METNFTGITLYNNSTMKYNFSGVGLSEVPENCIVLNTTTADFIPWNNPHNLISREASETWERITHGIFLPIMFVISVPCNTLNIVIFYKLDIKDRINLCLFFLSLADLIYMVQAFCRRADRIYLELTHQPLMGALLQFMTNNNINGLYGFDWVSSWITTIIACERCFCVVSPLRSKTVLKTQTMWVIILLPSTVLLAMFFVISAKWNIVCVFHINDGFPKLNMYPSKFYLKNKEWIDPIDGWLFGLFFPQFCIVTVTFATIVTVVKLRTMSQWREKTSSAATTLSNRDVALTRMLVGTSVLFIATFISRSVLRFIMLFIKELRLGGHFHNTYRLSIVTAIFCTFINCTFNFFVYYTFGSKFRATLKTLFCRVKH